MKLEVAAVHAATPDVSVFTLRHPRRPELPAWTPGAHVDLHLPDARVRQYSLVGDPEERGTWRLAVKRETPGRGASAWVHASLQPGATALVAAPRNNFPLADGASRHVMVAGGIGVTPFVSMARVLARQGVDFVLHLCARSATSAPLLGELRAICGDALVSWFSDEGRRFDPAALGAASAGTHLYLCGPDRLVSPVGDAALATGWAQTAIHREFFVPASDDEFKPEPFHARIASTGEMLHVPADRTLLDALRQHGLAMPSACELGVCGACVCGYRDGVVIHRDRVLPLAARQDRMTPCVSRARVAVTLDM